MAELLLAGVDKIYRTRKKAVHAVKSLALEVRAGEIVALLGSSGCGKTSTLRMIAGFESVTGGTITIGGRQVQTLPPSRRGVAMAFEAYSLYPPLTIAENISFALKAARLPAAEQDAKVKAMAEMLEIGDILGKYPGSVSGGQQQRASLGRALVREADLYLLDEPMGQLEPQLRAVLRGRIKHYLREHRCTTILVTHDQTEANALADRIAVMEGGMLQQYATPAELKARPANLFTGTFIGEPPMNVFEARVTARDGALDLDIGHGRLASVDASALPAALQEQLRQTPLLSIGIRPHALQVGEGPIRGRIMSCQWLGDQTHVAVDVDGKTVVAVSQQRISRPSGTEVGLSAAPGDLHIFDPATGRALAHGNEAA
jgi:multiple sugar transport system ATP-binding protein